MSDFFHPKLQAVEALAPYRLRTTWSTGEVSHQMFDTWMHRNGLSLNTAADALGISRRMVSYYRTAHKAIPRAIWLACLGWEATRPRSKTLPRALPTAREYALAHA